jgi:predicted TIM-barrel fold metal-dependent hydrolase
MSKKYPVIDTHLTVGVSPHVHFIAEEELIPWVDEAGVDIQIICQPDETFFHETPDWNPYLGNDYIAKIQRMYPTRVMGLCTLQIWHQKNPAAGSTVTRNPAIEELERCILDLGLHGIRMNPIQHNYQFNNRNAAWPILTKLSALQKQAKRRLIVSVHAYGDSLNNSPEALAETARQFPDLLFIMEHSAFVWGYGTVPDTAAMVQNIMLDLTTMPQFAVVYEAYQRYGPKKFTIGTDGPIATPNLKRAILRDFCRNEEEEELVLGGNLAFHFGIERIEK